MIQTQTYRNGNIPQMHTDQGAADVHTGVGPDMLHSHRGLEIVPGSCGEGTSGLGLGVDVYRLIAVLAGTGCLDDQRTVQMLAALGGQEDPLFLQKGKAA